MNKQSGADVTILHYSGGTWDGSGVHAVIRQLAPAMRVRSILGVSPGFEPRQLPRLKVWRGPAVEADAITLGNAWAAAQVAWRVGRWLRRGKGRVFHGHTRAGLLVALWLAAVGARRVVATVHVYGRQRWFYRIAHRVLGERLVWLTPAMKMHYGVGDLSWAGCMPNGLALEQAAAFKPWPGGRPLRVGGAGMLTGWKRWDLVLQALALEGGQGVEFFHIGGGEGTAETEACGRALRNLAERLGVAARVHWLGWQPSSAALLQQVDVVVVPSDGEPFSMIALEALFAGVPVLATRGGGPEDFIVPGRNGWLVPAGDAAALAAALAQCGTPEAWAHLRQDEAGMRRFSVKATLADRWERFYEDL